LVREWQPAIQDLKDGGTWADTPTADERELIVAQLADVEDSFIGDVSAASQDELIQYLRSMRSMLQKARQYTITDWQDTPVDLMAQGYGETNPRYTRIKNWRTLRDGFPYGPPMWDTIEGVAVEDFELVIEHGAWTENPSGTATAVEISTVETYDGRNLGNVDSTGARDPTTSNEVYIGTKRNDANLTDVYVDDGGVFGPNLMDAAPPFNLLPAVPVVNDAIYFGIDTTLANSGPFASLVFDIGTAGAGYTAAWEIWTGAWVALAVQDNTNADGAMTGIALDTTGVNSVHWKQPSGWVTTAVNAITGYWVRLRVTGIPGALTAPTQQNRIIYSITWPYVEVQSTAVGGDIHALSSIEADNRSDSLTLNLYQSRVVIGLRSLDRGDDFTAYINLADEQNPTNLNVVLGAGPIFANNVISPTGRVVQFTTGATGTERLRVTAYLTHPLVLDYYGQYHIYVRMKQTSGAANSIEFHIRLENDARQYFRSESVFLETLNDWEILDFGVIQIPSRPIEDFEEQLIGIKIYSTDPAAAGVDLYDIVLIPVDEWAIDTSDITDYNTKSSIGRQNTRGPLKLRIESIKDKTNIVSVLLSVATDLVSSSWISIPNGRSILQANSDQRLWFLSFRGVTGTDELYSNPYTADRVLLYRNQQYWSMRGDG
jgi:hypothetical protein